MLLELSNWASPRSPSINPLTFVACTGLRANENVLVLYCVMGGLVREPLPYVSVVVWKIAAHEAADAARRENTKPLQRPSET